MAVIAALSALLFSVQPANASNCNVQHELDRINLPSACLSPSEAAVIRMRLFRADLAIAALTCNRSQSYNNFVTRHRDVLVRDGQALKAFYERLHGDQATAKLNRFITHLANRASIRSLAANGYCRAMDRVFAETLTITPDGLRRYIQSRPVRSALTSPSVAQASMVK